MKIISSISILLLLAISFAQGQKIFDPPDKKDKRIIEATQIETNLNVDGKLNEPAWQNAKAYQQFTQVEPLQGNASKFILRTG